MGADLSKKLFFAFAILLILLFAGLFIFGIWQAFGLREIYSTEFNNQINVILPDEVYSSIQSNELQLRINKKTELGEYTTTVNVAGQTFTQTWETKIREVRNRNSDSPKYKTELVDEVLILSIPKAKEFSIQISPQSNDAFKLLVFEKKW